MNERRQGKTNDEYKQQKDAFLAGSIALAMLLRLDLLPRGGHEIEQDDAHDDEKVYIVAEDGVPTERERSAVARLEVAQMHARVTLGREKVDRVTLANDNGTAHLVFSSSNPCGILNVSAIRAQ